MSKGLSGKQNGETDPAKSVLFLKPIPYAETEDAWNLGERSPNK